jgi:hypothetical protein
MRVKTGIQESLIVIVKAAYLKYFLFRNILK